MIFLALVAQSAYVMVFRFLLMIVRAASVNIIALCLISSLIILNSSYVRKAQSEVDSRAIMVGKIRAIFISACTDLSKLR